MANKELQALMNKLNKKFGENSLITGEEMQNLVVERIPTGSVALDIDLGGGIPIGRFTQISGALSSTKSSQCMHIVREAQKMGLVCAWGDVEGTSDREYFEQMGVDTESLLYTRPNGLEEITQMFLDMQQSGLVHLAVWDSIEASSPIKEMDSTMDETVQMGVKQKLLAEFFRKYQAFNNKLVREGKRPFTLIGINQLREKIGAYGDAEYTPGGRAIGYTASVDLRLRKGDWITNGTGTNKTFVGQVVKYKIEKNKTYKRMQTGEFDFYYDENDLDIPVGHNDNFKSIVQLGIERNLIQRGGAWFFINKDTDQEMKFQGQDNLIAYLRENDGLVEDIKRIILDIDAKTL